MEEWILVCVWSNILSSYVMYQVRSNLNFTTNLGHKLVVIFYYELGTLILACAADVMSAIGPRCLKI